jgi:hypothetical protein
MVRDMLRSEEIETLFGHISRKDSVDELVNASLNETRETGHNV